LNVGINEYRTGCCPTVAKLCRETRVLLLTAFV